MNDSNNVFACGESVMFTCKGANQLMYVNGFLFVTEENNKSNHESELVNITFPSHVS